jgi:predicted nuclease with TOPRIM domain
MVTVDQVRQLEARVARIIEHVNNLTGENTLLKADLDNAADENALLKTNLDNITSENTLLKTNLDSYQKRIDEMEVLIQRFKEEQARIEEGVIAALDRLNQFEDDIRKTIDSQPAGMSVVEPPQSVPPPSYESPADDGGEDAVPQTYPATGDNTATADGTEPESELDIF